MELCVIILALLLNSSVLAELRKEGPCTVSHTSNKGSEFVLASINDNYGPFDVKLFVSSTENVSISVEFPNQEFRTMFIIINRGTQEITIDRSIVQSNIGISNKSIVIRSSSPISIHGLRDPFNYLAEAFTALPIESLSRTYVVPSYYLYTDYSLNIVIASVHDGTSVSIILKINGNITFENNVYKNGDTIHVQLKRLQTFMLQHRSDFSGTIIKSNKPISVLSGGDVVIPTGTVDVDLVLSQLLPVEHWDTEFIVPPLYPRSDSLMRIYAFHPNTSVSIRNETHSKARNLPSGNFLEEVIGNGPVVVNSSQPISVVQYAFSETHDSSSHGDPLMMIIPGIHQFSSDYLFPTKTVHNEIKHYVSVIINKNMFAGLRLNGALRVDRTFDVHFNGEDYIVGIQEVTGSFHRLTHIDANIKFGALVYGFGRYFGYGFPAGFEFREIVSCDTTQIPLPTADSHSKENKIICFSCTGMTHLKYCDLVDTCSDTLGCFVERNQIGSHLRYNSGCAKSHVESCEVDKYDPGRCYRCCNTSYCNSYGCGDDVAVKLASLPAKTVSAISFVGFGSSDLRGPLCYDCKYLNDPSDCINIVPCPLGELCYIEEHPWGANDKVYSMGCRPKYQCRSPSSALNPVFGRSVATCSECCVGDFCNTDCTALASTAIIG